MTATAHADPYFEEIKGSLPRLLSLLDRNPSSPTYGCFDRSYWLHRKTDFATSTAQMSVRTLALLYKTPFSGNWLFGERAVLEWIRAGLEFTLTLQHGDGSFDEWYPNERGWAGPTGYVAHAIHETITLVGQELPAQLVTAIDKAMERAAYHLALRDEGEVLANHHAIALLPLTLIARRLDKKPLLESSERWLREFKRLITPEGWSVEYDGCDLGYNLGTLNFLADLHRETQEPFLIECARKSFSFLSHFAYPDGTWAGAIGSRHTVHSYPFALEYWARIVPEGRPLLKHMREAIRRKTLLKPADQEDHYIHYRLADYLKAAAFAYNGDLSSAPLPYEAESFTLARFPEAGFHVEKRGSLALWMALKRGGAFRLYCLETGRLLAANNGCLVLGAGKKAFTSLWQNASSGSEEALRAESPLHPVFTKRFTPFSFLLFRLACSMMFLPLPAYWFKLWIRKRMITHKNASSSKWRREVEWLDSSIVVRDELDWQEGPLWSCLYWGGEFHTRYVPQAQYCTPSEARFPPQRFVPADFQQPRRAAIEWVFDMHTGETGVRAQ